MIIHSPSVDLIPDTIGIIGNYLPSEQIARTRQVSRTWKRGLEIEYIWKRRIDADYPWYDKKEGESSFSAYSKLRNFYNRLTRYEFACTKKSKLFILGQINQITKDWLDCDDLSNSYYVYPIKNTVHVFSPKTHYFSLNVSFGDTPLSSIKEDRYLSLLRFNHHEIWDLKRKKIIFSKDDVDFIRFNREGNYLLYIFRKALNFIPLKESCPEKTPQPFAENFETNKIWSLSDRRLFLDNLNNLHFYSFEGTLLKKIPLITDLTQSLCLSTLELDNFIFVSSRYGTKFYMIDKVNYNLLEIDKLYSSELFIHDQKIFFLAHRTLSYLDLDTYKFTGDIKYLEKVYHQFEDIKLEFHCADYNKIILSNNIARKFYIFNIPSRTFSYVPFTNKCTYSQVSIFNGLIRFFGYEQLQNQDPYDRRSNLILADLRTGKVLRRFMHRMGIMQINEKNDLLYFKHDGLRVNFETHHLEQFTVKLPEDIHEGWLEVEE